MNRTCTTQIDQGAEGVIVAVDLDKLVYQLRVANQQWCGIESHRLTRSQFERWILNRMVSLVIMEACGSAHHWARWLTNLGIDVLLLPPAYIRAYVRRNKTDAADAAALLEAARNSDIKPVRVKTVEQQALQAMHRTRSLWMAARTQHINAMRDFCREFGLHIPVGAKTGLTQIAGLIGDVDIACSNEPGSSCLSKSSSSMAKPRLTFLSLAIGASPLPLNLSAIVQVDGHQAKTQGVIRQRQRLSSPAAGGGPVE